MSPHGPDPRLSALIVNYRSGAFAMGCVRSLQHEWSRSGLAADRLEIIVVDNDSGEDEAEHLERLRRCGARVIASESNGGYASGLNLAFAASSGEEGDYVALLNPDLWFLPGSLRTLLSYLELHPDCGAVGPRIWLDEERTFALPPISLPTAASELAAEMASFSPGIARRRAATRTAHCLGAWCEPIPRSVSMLSGACVLLPRDVALALDGPMDQRYPLYYEDADLARRIQARGLTTVQHCQADVVHHWSRSAGFGASFEEGPRQRWAESRRAYHRRWFGRAGLKSLAGAEALGAKWFGKRPQALHDYAVVEAGKHPLDLQLPGSGEILLELSADPLFALAAGHFAQGGQSWSFPVSAWSWLFPGRYYLRALSLPRVEVLGAWKFDKTTAARTWPVGSVGPLLDDPEDFESLLQLTDATHRPIEAPEAH